MTTLDGGRMIKKQSLLHWTPMIFWAFVVYVYVYRGAHSPDSWQYLAIWLTMCFFYVGAVTYTMQKRIHSLTAELQQLRQLVEAPIKDA
jgi:hypothetical protein